jgi:hypothetical protein
MHHDRPTSRETRSAEMITFPQYGGKPAFKRRDREQVVRSATSECIKRLVAIDKEDRGG